MSRHFDDLLATAAKDGACAPIGVLTSRNGAEFEQLMEAWYIERQSSIECSLLLDQARQLLTRLLNEGEVTDTNRRKTRGLLQAIKEARQEPHPRGF